MICSVCKGTGRVPGTSFICATCDGCGEIVPAHTPLLATAPPRERRRPAGELVERYGR